MKIHGNISNYIIYRDIDLNVHKIMNMKLSKNIYHDIVL